MVGKNKAMDLINKKYSDSEIDDKITEMMYKVGSSNKENQRYQHSYVFLEYVIENPQEYIIPECMPACNHLWEKNMETFMVSNYDNDYLYVILDNLSDENIAIIEDLSKVDTRYFWDEFRHYWGIRVNGVSKESSEELAKLTNVFVLQDTKRYQTAEDFLDSYKRTNGKTYIDEYGHIVHDYNPELVNATLEEALKNRNCEDLYVPEEGRIYDNQIYLEWHNRYKKSLSDSKAR